MKIKSEQRTKDTMTVLHGSKIFKTNTKNKSNEYNQHTLKSKLKK